MSEKLDKTEEKQPEQIQEDLEKEPIAKESQKSEPATEPENDDAKLEKLFEMIKTIVANKDNIIKEINDRREYLVNNLADYDNENYLQNDAFKSLYSQAFGALGTKLDTKKFIELVESYVNSRIELNNRKLEAQKENETLTDSLEFENGVPKKNNKKLRFQDIPPEELEKYIGMYL